MTILNSEVSKIYEKWQKTEYLDGIQDEFVGKSTAVLLENQFVLNNDFTPIALKLISKVFPKLIINEIAGMQVASNPVSNVYFMVSEYRQQEISLVVKSEKVICVSRNLKLRINDDSCENIEKWANEIVKDFNYEHLSNINNNVGHVVKCSSEEDICPKLICLRNLIYGGTLHPATFVVMKQEVYDKYSSQIDDLKMKVFCPEGWDSPNILMGYKGHSFLNSGYFISPYVAFTKILITNGEYGLIYRGGKILVEGGSKYYGRLELNS